jgi:hypothetical protein
MIIFAFIEYGSYNSGGTAYGGYAGYSQPAPTAGGAGATTAATSNYPSSQGYDQSGYNQQGSWGQQQGYGNYGTTGDQTSYPQQGYMDSSLYFLWLLNLEWIFAYAYAKLCIIASELVEFIKRVVLRGREEF